MSTIEHGTETPEVTDVFVKQGAREDAKNKEKILEKRRQMAESRHKQKLKEHMDGIQKKRRLQRLNRWIRNYQNSLHSMAQPHSPPFKTHLESIFQLF